MLWAGKKMMREDIIDDAIKEFTKTGLKFTMTDAAKRMGISKSRIKGNSGRSTLQMYYVLN